MSSRVYAYLSINGFTCTHDEVAELVGLAPRRVWKIGEHTRAGKLIEVNSWSSCTPVAPNEEQPHYHVLAVIEHIATRPASLVQFLRKHDSGINCVGEFRRINGGFHMARDLVAKCAELGLWLDFDLYNYSCEDEP
jgi:hypothetical protein